MPHSMTTFKTADLCDRHGDAVQVCFAPLMSFGGMPSLAGKIATVETLENATFVRRMLDEPGNGRVLVVDGGGSRRVALLGDQMALLAIKNRWAGVVIFGAVRDVTMLRELPLAVFALGTVPARANQVHPGRTGHALRFGDALFVPGGYVYGDSDGLVTATQDLS
jgi:regulator of ribonuclease activity A